MTPAWVVCQVVGSEERVSGNVLEGESPREAVNRLLREAAIRWPATFVRTQPEPLCVFWHYLVEVPACLRVE